MIEQVLYRRTIDQGYNEYCSSGLSKEEAHRVNVVMDTVASGIDDLGSGADSPYMFYPFASMNRVCLATFQREFSKGRSNSVNHALLIEDEEYKELVKNPEKIWGFTSKCFLSRKVNHRNELFVLQALDVSQNAELCKDFIFTEYSLNNDGFLKYLNAIYTSLSKNKNYSCGLRIDNSKDANKVMRHLGYLLMSMLPYELRDKISFCSRSVPDSIGITIQILQEKDPEKTDITYNMNTYECLVNNSSVELSDFYLSDLMTMTDAELKDYFGILAEFKDNLNITRNSEVEYVVSKLLKLSQKPSMFASETAEVQLTFINDVFSLPTSNSAVINSIVARLLPFVNPSHYMEAFNINFGLYRGLNSENEYDRQIMTQIEENLVQNYNDATTEEKRQLFMTVFNSTEVHTNVYTILEKFVEINKIELDSLLLNEYINLYEEFFGTEWRRVLYWKIVEVYKQRDIQGKEKIWNRMYNSAKTEARNRFIYNILSYEDEPFHKVIFDSLVNLFIILHSQKIKERCYIRIRDVIHKEDDAFRLKVLREYNDVEEVEATLWLETYNAISDYQRAATDVEFLRCLRDKYYKSSNTEVCDLYLGYISCVPLADLERIIRQYGKQVNTSDREDRLLNEIIYFLTNDKKKVSVDVLKVLATVVKEEGVNDLAHYISTLYLSTSSDSSIEVYDFLETEQPRLYNNPNLNKQYLPSYDNYLATKLDKRILNDDNKLVSFLKDLESLVYHEECYSRIRLIYQKWVDQEITTAGGDYERYLKGKELCGRLSCISQTQFGDQHFHELIAQIQDGFWKASNINTFDFGHCNIYESDSELFNHRYRDHENHVLAENISGLIGDSFVDWDKLYKILLSKKSIPQDTVRNQIVKDFERKYDEYGLSKSDPNYIAFVCVNKNSFKMDYGRLFDTLQKYNYRIDDKSIRKIKIFEYIRISDQLGNKISEYKNFQSDDPTYGEVIRGLFFEQIAVLILLIANNTYRIFTIKMSENSKTGDILLLCNYVGYILLIAIVGFISVLLMKRANMRRSTKYDTVVFGLLILNILLSAAAILISVFFTKIYICFPAAIVFMMILIIISAKIGNKIGSPKESNKTRK